MSVYPTYTDNELFHLIQSDDKLAFTELYNRYWEKLLYIAGIKLRDLAIAEELVQDVFFDIWNRRAVIQLTGEIRAYLAVSMKYKVINAQAKIKRAQAWQEYAGKQLPAADCATEHWLNFEELKDRLAALVAALPERCQITYRLSREAGLSHKEIAGELQITEKAVERNLTRALKTLRTGLQNFLALIFL